MIMRVPCVLTIAGSDSGGGAGIQVDLKTFAALGVHGLCVVSSITAQNTRGLTGIFDLPVEVIEKQFKSVVSDFPVRFAKTGMLNNPKTVRAVRRLSRQSGLRLVVDPVMVSTTGHRLLQSDALPELLRLMGEAELVTPNIREAELLASTRIRGVREMEKAAREIRRITGAKAVLIKGGHLPGSGMVTDVLLFRNRIFHYPSERVGGPFHGAGCSYSAAITAELAKNRELREAVGRARNFIATALVSSSRLGRGNLKIVNPLASLHRAASTGEVIAGIWSTATRLVSNPKFVHLIPEVGINIAVVPLGATTPGDVVGLSGRIVRTSRGAVLTGFPEPGGSEHVARATLTAHQLNPEITAGMNIRFDRVVLHSLRGLGFPVYSFDRREEPKKTKTMEWGIRTALRSKSSTPMAVYDTGAPGKEPMIRIFARNIGELERLVLKLLDRLSL